MAFLNDQTISEVEKSSGIQPENQPILRADSPPIESLAGNISDEVLPKYKQDEISILENELSPGIHTEKEKPLEKAPIPMEPGSMPTEYTGFWGMMRAAANDFGTGIAESGGQVIGAARDVSQDIINLIYKGGENIRESKWAPEWSKYSLIYDNGTVRVGSPLEKLPIPTIPLVKEAQTVTGKIIRSIAEFSSALIPSSKILRSAGVSNGMIRAAAAGASADLIVTNKGDKLLSNLINEYPTLQNPITDFLATKPDDTMAETKFKAAIEGLALGASGEILLGGLRRIKAVHSAPTAAQLLINDGIEQIHPKLEQYTGSVREILNDLPIELQLKIVPKLEELEGLPGRLTSMQSAGMPSADSINKLEFRTNDTINGISEMITRYAPDKGEYITKFSKETTAAIDNVVSDSGKLVSGLARGRAFNNKYRALLGDKKAPLLDKAGNINFAHIEADTDVKKVIQLMSQEPEVIAASKVQSHKVTEELANSLNLSVDDLLRRKEGEAWNAQYILAARNLVVGSAKKIANLSDLVYEGAGEAEKLALYGQMGIHRAIQAQLTGIGSEAGRALNIYNKSVKGYERAGGTVLDIEGINNYIKNIDNGEVPIEKIAQTISMLKNDPGKLAAFLSKPEKLTKMEAFAQYRTACLLTSPKTHATNILSNALNAFWQIPERMLAEHMKTNTAAQAVSKGEWKHLAYGTLMGLKDSLKLMRSWDFWKSGQDVSHETYKYTHRQISSETMPALGWVADLMGKWVNIPMKALSREDELFKVIGARAEQHAISYRIATGEGLSGENLANRITQLMDNPTPEMEQAIGDYQKYITFQQETDGFFKGMEHLVNSHPAMRIIVPFVRTPSNIFTETIERTPFAPLTNQYKEAIKKGGAEGQLAMARMKLGTGTLSLMGMLAAGGYITSGGPIDKNMRRAKMASGWQPYSLKVNNKYYSYSRLEPISGVLGLGADALDVIGATTDPKQADSIIRDVGLIMAHYLDDKTYLKGMADTLDLIFDPTANGISSWMAKLVGTSHPLGQGGIWINQYVANDKVMRDARGWLEQLMIRTPGLSKEVPPLVDFWGDPLPIKPGLGPDAFSPIAYSVEKNDPVSKALMKYNIKLSMPRRVMTFGGHGSEGISLNQEQYNTFVKASNGRSKIALAKVVNTKEFKNSSDELRQLIFNDIINGYKVVAKQEIYNSYPALKQKVDQRRKEWQTSLLTGESQEEQLGRQFEGQLSVPEM